MKPWWMVPLAIGIIAGFIATKARAHDWYDVGCCAGNDCEPIPADAITDRGDQFEINYSSPRFGDIHEFFPYADVKQSKDGQFHICIQEPQSLTGKRLRCVYEPVTG